MHHIRRPTRIGNQHSQDCVCHSLCACLVCVDTVVDTPVGSASHSDRFKCLQPSTAEDALPVSQKSLSASCPEVLCLPTVGLASDDKQAEVQAAKTAGDMWKAIGKDSWVVVPIASTSRPGTDTHARMHARTALHTVLYKVTLLFISDAIRNAISDVM